MAFHTFDVAKADRLEDPGRYRFCSREELVAALDLPEREADATVADLGSGTGFYTDDVAPYAAQVYGVDIQSEMHDLYREKGVPENVTLVTSGIEDLPFEDDALDAAFSTMTYHEFATPATLAELARVLAPGGRLVTVDWARDGDGADGPTVEERFTSAEAATAMRGAGFTIESASLRRETFVIVAEAP
ncbi:class I SAM-dependent methyltransferase [Halorubrum gandharaense]